MVSLSLCCKQKRCCLAPDNSRLCLIVDPSDRKHVVDLHPNWRFKCCNFLPNVRCLDVVCPMDGIQAVGLRQLGFPHSETGGLNPVHSTSSVEHVLYLRNL